MKKDETTETGRTVKICHVSDFHLPIPGGFPFYKLLSKRILGWANLQLLRSRTHEKEPFLKLMNRMVSTCPDVTVATGDLVNLALENEYVSISGMFDDLGFNHDNLVLVPGNHDRYTPGSHYMGAFEKGFSKWMPSEDRSVCYPSFKKLGPIGIIGLDTAVWRSPARAAGRIDKGQLVRFEALLHGACANLRPVIAMHHPPLELLGSGYKHYFSGLQGYKKVLNLLEGRNAIVLHGHIHQRTDITINDTRILGVTSASNNVEAENKTMSFHTLEFDEDGGVDITATCYHSSDDSFETITL